MGVVGILATLCCGMAVPRLAIVLVLRSLRNSLGYLPTLGIVVVAVVATLTAIRLNVHAAQRALRRWGEQTGWSPVVDRTTWPWTAAHLRSDTVQVQAAVANTVHGHPMVVGELSWTAAGLGDSTDRSSGHGLFAIARLPRRYPRASVQRRRIEYRRRAGEDEFVRKFRIVIADLTFADQVTSAALQGAHLAGRVPTWTIEGDELHAIVPTRRRLRPARAVALTEQMHLLLRLLGIADEPATADDRTGLPAET